MAEIRLDEADNRSEERPEARRDAPPVMSLEEQARVLADLHARQVAQAGRLPEPRLDEKHEAPLSQPFRVFDGIGDDGKPTYREVDANGQPLGKSGDAQR